MALKKLRELKKLVKTGGSVSKNVQNCLFCSDQQDEITKCCIKNNVSEKPIDVLRHIYISCSDCRFRLKLIAEHERKSHKD